MKVEWEIDFRDKRDYIRRPKTLEILLRCREALKQWRSNNAQWYYGFLLTEVLERASLLREQGLMTELDMYVAHKALNGSVRTRAIFILNDCRMILVPLWKGQGRSRHRWVSGEESGAWRYPAFHCPFHVFWWKNSKRERSSKKKGIWIKRCLFLTSGKEWREELNFSQLLKVSIRVSSQCLALWAACWWSPSQAAAVTSQHLSSQTFEGPVINYLWLCHSVCSDRGTGGRPCVAILELRTPRQLLEGVWIYQPVICDLPCLSPPLSLSPATRN